MALPRYVVQAPPGSGADWPDRQPGHAALVPYFTRHAGSGAYQYKDGVVGQPGTQAIPVDTKGWIPSPDLGDIALMGLGRSSDAPDVFYPNLYWARPQRAYWPGAGMPVSAWSDNLMPVPAADPRGIPATRYHPLNQRDRTQVQERPKLPRWPARS